MNSVSLPSNPTDKDIDKLRSLFREYDKDKDGKVTKQELALICARLDQKPQPFEIVELFIGSDLTEVEWVDQNTFVIWYLGLNLGIARLVRLYLGLKYFQEQVQSAAPPSGNQKVKHSFIKLESQASQASLNKHIMLDVLVNPQMVKQRLEHYQNITKKYFGPVCVVLSFSVNSKANQIRQKLEATVNALTSLVNQLSEEAANFLKLVNITCSNTENQVVMVIETQHPLFTLLANELNRLLTGVNPNIMAHLNCAIKTDSIDRILNNQSFSSDLEFNLKLDSHLLQKIKKSLSQSSAEQTIPMVFLMLLQEVKLRVKSKNAEKEFIAKMGIPKINLKQEAVNLKQKVNIQELMQSFLPSETFDLIRLLRENGRANLSLNLFVACVNIRVDLKVEGIREVIDLFIQ